jgi:hypothetical protein
VLLARVPGYDFEVLEVDDDHATGRIKTPTGWKPPHTVRRTDRAMVVYAERNVDNYRDKPQRMWVARLTTDLIDLYAKGVIRGIVRAEAGVEWFTDQGEAPAGDPDPAPLGGSVPPGSGSPALPAGPPPRSVAPDGSTIPEHLREPEVDAEVRTELLNRVTGLDEATVADLSEVCKDLKIPNLKTVRFTRAHGALLTRLITEAVERNATDNAGRPFD